MPNKVNRVILIPFRIMPYIPITTNKDISNLKTDNNQIEKTKIEIWLKNPNFKNKNKREDLLTLFISPSKLRVSISLVVIFSIINLPNFQIIK